MVGTYSLEIYFILENREKNDKENIVSIECKSLWANTFF